LTERNRLMRLAESIPRSRTLFDEPMCRHTSFRIGGPADLLVIPANLEDLRKTVGFCIDNQVPLFVMGSGTNLLVKDGGIRGVVAKLSGTLDHIRFDGDLVTAGSGARLAELSRQAMEHGLSGLEFACGIPGSVGGAVVMNAGAYDGEMKDVVRSVTVLSRDEGLVTIDAGEMDFGYRRSRPQDTGDIVVEAVMSLIPGDRARIASRMEELERRRREKQPLDLPSAGSVFKRPEGHYAGTLIEKAGLKGMSVGGARVSELHAGFIVNTGGATAKDVLRLIEIVRDEVMRRFGVLLTPEIRIVGED